MDVGSHRLSQGDQGVSTFFVQSSFATHAVVHERNVVKVDESVDLALLGPLGCGIQTGAGTILNRLKPEIGSAIAIFGAGAVGLCAIMEAKIVGCHQIVAVDMRDNRLNMAKELGATYTLLSKIVEDGDEVSK